MAQLEEIVIVFDTDPLPEAERFDLARRKEILEYGIQQLSEHVPGVEAVTLVPTACAAHVRGTSHQIDDVKSFIERSNLGVCEVHDPDLFAV